MIKYGRKKSEFIDRLKLGYKNDTYSIQLNDTSGQPLVESCRTS